jgi:hypothetical protein
MDGVARREIAPAIHRIGIEREIEDRERADPVKGPGSEPFHPASMSRDAGLSHISVDETVSLPAA